MSLGGVQPVPEQQPGPSVVQWLIKVAQALNLMLQGKINATTSVTLRSGQTTTTLTDSRIGNTSVLLFMPTTAHAATAHGTIYITDLAQGSCTINHANTADADKTFGVVIITG